MRYLFLLSILVSYLNSFSQLEADMDSVDVSCFQGIDGIAIASPTGGTPPYTYLWDDPSMQFTDTAFGLAAGMYKVIITDSLGATHLDSVTVNQPTDISINPNPVYPLCYGMCDGSISTNPTGGTPPYTYLWSPLGATSSMVTGLCAGLYNVTVTDDNGCVANDSIAILEPPLLTAIFNTVDDTCGFCNGSATVFPTGGVAPYSYSWNTVPVQTSSTASNLCFGNYTCTIIDMNGCMEVVNVTINQAPGLACQLGTINGTVLMTLMLIAIKIQVR